MKGTKGVWIREKLKIGEDYVIFLHKKVEKILSSLGNTTKPVNMNQ